MNGHDIPCSQIVEMVTDYLEGALDPERARLFEEHLAECPSCDRYVEQIRITVAQVGTVEEPDLSPTAWEELRAAFHGLT